MRSTGVDYRGMNGLGPAESGAKPCFFVTRGANRIAAKRKSRKEEGGMGSVTFRVAVLFALASMAAFGCGKTEERGKAPSGGTPATTETGAEKTAAQPEKGAKPAERGAKEKAPAGAIRVKVGVVLPLNGENATFGVETENGINLAVTDIKAEGKTWPEMITVDNGGSPTQTASAVKRFIDSDKVSVILGPVTSNEAIAAGDQAEAGMVPLVTPTATNVMVTVNKKYVFRVCYTDDVQGPMAANFAYDTLKARRAAVLVNSSESYSMGLGDAFVKRFKERGGEIVSQMSFTKDTDDFGAQISQLRLKSPDAIFLPAYYEATAKCISQARAAGLRSTFVGTDGWDSPNLYTLSAGAVKGNYFTTHFSPQEDRTAVKRFVQNYRAAYNEEPGALAALGYDAAMVVFAAVERAGSSDREAITKAIAETRDFDGVTGKITIDANHNAVKNLVILETGEKSASLKTVVSP
jgi:branched-chain amino acid transport system substrate-binding protein